MLKKEHLSCWCFSILFLMFSILLYFPLIFAFSSFLEITAAASESDTPAMIFIEFLSMAALGRAMLISIAAAISGLIGAVLSCFNVKCEVRATRNSARALLAVNGVLALICPIGYLTLLIVSIL